MTTDPMIGITIRFSKGIEGP